MTINVRIYLKGPAVLSAVSHALPVPDGAEGGLLPLAHPDGAALAVHQVLGRLLAPAPQQ